MFPSFLYCASGIRGGRSFGKQEEQIQIMFEGVSFKGSNKIKNFK